MSAQDFLYYTLSVAILVGMVFMIYLSFTILQILRKVQNTITAIENSINTIKSFKADVTLSVIGAIEKIFSKIVAKGGK